MAMRGHSAYNQTIIQTVDDKGKILLMLYDGAIKFVRYARSGIEENDPKTKGENISKLLAILNELDCALNREMSEDYIENLSFLYRHMMNLITIANIKNDTGPLTEVESILSELKEGFEAAFIRERGGAAESPSLGKMEAGKKEGVK